MAQGWQHNRKASHWQREVEQLRRQLSTKESQLRNLRQQIQTHTDRQLGSLSGTTAAEIKARLLEEAERARAEAERHAAQLQQTKIRLKTAYGALERRSTQLEAAAQIAREAAGILDVNKLLETTVHLISDRFGFYQAAVFLVSEDGKYAIMRAASWEGGEKLVAQGYKLLIGYQGIAGQVARTGEPRVNAVSPDSSEADLQSEAALPLKVRERVIGVLNVRSLDPAAFTEDEIAILQTLADQVAVALDNARLFEQIKRHSRQLLTATEVSKSVMTILDPAKLMPHTATLIREGFDLHYVGIFLVDEDEQSMILRAGSGKDGNVSNDKESTALLAVGHKVPLDSPCAIGESIREARALLSGLHPSKHAKDDDDKAGEHHCVSAATLPQTRSEMVLPLFTRGKAIGALTIQSTRAAAFSEEDIPVFQTMVDQIAIALDNAWLFKEINEAKTAAKEALEVAKRAQQAAEAANQAKSAFLANMSHELRTPLNAILGFTQLMQRDTTLSAAQRENVETINRSGMHLLSLINDVLEMSKIEAGRMVLEERSFDLRRMLDEIEAMFRLRAEDKGLMLTFECCDDVPRYVLADEHKLRQVLINLLGNAVKFTREGGVTLRVRSRQVDADDPTAGYDLHFEVEDSGPGISAEDQELLFEPFVQTNSREFTEGTGLGLPISRQFIGLMGGEIGVESEVGRGSCFRFDVRVQQGEAQAVRAEAPVREVIGLAPGQRAPDGGSYRLLVIEDREANRRLLVKLLTSLGAPPEGFEVRAAANGEEGRRRWERWHPHLIWMDMRMPVMDGYEVTRRIKATPAGEETVIIALTASAFEEDRVTMLELGCDDFVRKPFRSSEIFEKIAQHLGVRYLYDQAEDAGEAAAPGGADALARRGWDALPAPLIAQLEQAAIENDFLQVETLIEEVRAHDPALAQQLERLADDFAYDRIAAAIQTINS